MSENYTKKEDKFHNPDEKPPKSSPSYLIWSLFTKERKLQKARSVERKIYTSDGNRAKISEAPHSKSAPPGKWRGNASNLNSAHIISSQLAHDSFCSSQEEVMDHDHDSLLWIKVEGRK